MFLSSLRVHSKKISTAKEKYSTDVSAASACFSISGHHHQLKKSLLPFELKFDTSYSVAESEFRTCLKYVLQLLWPAIDPSMHYRLRPIKWGQFRFSNFPSHFISVQIFQIDLSTLPLILSVSKYFRYAFRTRNESFFFFY